MHIDVWQMLVCVCELTFVNYVCVCSCISTCQFARVFFCVVVCFLGGVCIVECLFVLASCERLFLFVSGCAFVGVSVGISM